MPSRTATTDAPILDVLTERWSTRIFDASAPIDEEALQSALEAARWSPSASNTQPWRFIVARRGSASHTAVVDSLMGFNRSWAADAAALVVFVATTEQDGKALRWAAYDVGQAAAHFTVQAHADGLGTHQMGGFHADRIAESFGLGDDQRALTVMAVGPLGDPDAASEELRAREDAPRERRPIAESLLVDD
ncbi:nitroreductase family protein [Microbacterium oleivorans]|uniref:nitroreductase family protein n=1 Tax=Microbacterium oleivorans TaxID=273677 RepID=UPI00203A694A|nr:nitroreductase family protein [Microbacterium oleivorans]MCM3697647.1 nitroreductase family protein [Microbacterium oleivorans]